jgi:hypothetical protein
MPEIGRIQVRGLKLSARFQRYYDKCNTKYFDGKLPPVKVYTAPLLNLTQMSQKKVEEKRKNKDWADAGYYGFVGLNENEETCIVLDRGTSVFHPLISKQTILHEQIHLELDPYPLHGKQFKKEIRRIASLGALDDLI